MLNAMSNVIVNTLSKVAYSTVVNAYYALKGFSMGKQDATTSMINFTQKVGKDAGYEAARLGLIEAANFVPGGQMAQQGLAHVANVTVKGIQAGIEGNDVARTVAKNGLYALNTAVSGPILSFPLGFATDYVVDKAADKITYAYTNYKNGCEQKLSQMDPVKLANYRKNYTSECINEFDESFVLINKAACAA